MLRHRDRPHAGRESCYLCSSICSKALSAKPATASSFQALRANGCARESSSSSSTLRNSSVESVHPCNRFSLLVARNGSRALTAPGDRRAPATPLLVQCYRDGGGCNGEVALPKIQFLEMRASADGLFGNHDSGDDLVHAQASFTRTCVEFSGRDDAFARGAGKSPRSRRAR